MQTPLSLTENEFWHRSKLFINGALLVNNEGLHGMVERCESRTLSTGTHVVYVEGFQAGGGVGMELQYSGADTGNKKVLMRSASLPITQTRAGQYFKPCDPAAAAVSTQFTMCMFRSEITTSGSYDLCITSDDGYLKPLHMLS